MSAVVDYAYYTDVYLGTEADEASFPALCARAGDIIGAMIKWRNPETLGAFQLTLYKKAICAQIDFLAINGLDYATGGGNTDNGFTVGKVHINGRTGAENAKAGAMAGSVSPMAVMYLEQSGLMYPGVPTMGGCVC